MIIEVSEIGDGYERERYSIPPERVVRVRLPNISGSFHEECSLTFEELMDLRTEIDKFFMNLMIEHWRKG